MKTKLIRPAKTTHHAIAHCFSQELLELVRGKGVWLYDRSRNKYMDLGAGIAVNGLGYGRRDLAAVAARQMRKLIHTSNLYTTQSTIRFAHHITSYDSKIPKRHNAVFFSNSGAEANEAALKFARLYAYQKKGADHHLLVAFKNGFHGRTLGTISMNDNPAYKNKFEPLLPSVKILPYNDIDAVTTMLNRKTAGVIVEVVQGEGGLESMTPEFAHALNHMCAAHDIILIADEVQTGVGRTGTMFASEWAGLAPDIITLSKPLAGGLPLGATLVTDAINSLLQIGDHGSTFGGGPVTTALAHKIWSIVSHPHFLANLEKKCCHLDRWLTQIAKKHPSVSGLRGAGLLRGIVIGTDDAAQMVQHIIDKALERGIIILRSRSNVLRIAPPLIITTKEIDIGMKIIDDLLQEIDS